LAFQDGGNSSLRFDLFELDCKNSQLRRSGVAVELAPQALKILRLLTARPNELVTRIEIKEALWPGELHGDFDSRLNFTIKKLREALDDDAERPRYVQTVRNAGYMFIAPVREERKQSSGRDGDTRSHTLRAAGPASGNKLSLARSAFVTAVVVVAVAAAVVVGDMAFKPGLSDAAARGQLAAPVKASDLVDTQPQISSVSAIVPQVRQRIVIRGSGFGLHVPYVHTDSPYLAVRDQTRSWAAGRIIPQNSDEVTVDVDSWASDMIVVSGFSGDYGKNGWNLVTGDRLEIALWNPQSGSGPALFHLVVSADTR
jgi:DNA-binding winged helix-turn-helix (wHTH) protein